MLIKAKQNEYLSQVINYLHDNTSIDMAKAEVTYLKPEINIKSDIKYHKDDYSFETNLKLQLIEIKYGDLSLKFSIDKIIKKFTNNEFTKLFTERILDHIKQHGSINILNKGKFACHLGGEDISSPIIGIFKLPHQDENIYKLIANDSADCIKGQVTIGYNYQIDTNKSVYIIYNYNNIKEDTTKKIENSIHHYILGGLFISKINKYINNVLLTIGLDGNYLSSSAAIPLYIESMITKYLVLSMYLPFSFNDFQTNLQDNFKICIGGGTNIMGTTLVIEGKQSSIHFTFSISSHTLVVIISWEYSTNDIIINIKYKYKVKESVYKYNEWINKPIIIEQKPIIETVQNDKIDEEVQQAIASI